MTIKVLVVYSVKHSLVLLLHITTIIINAAANRLTETTTPAIRGTTGETEGRKG